jgi:hypothetical protein
MRAVARTAGVSASRVCGAPEGGALPAGEKESLVDRRFVFLAAAGLFALGLTVRSGPTAGAMHPWGCYKWNSTELTYNNVATSPYKAYYDQEAVQDADSWTPYTVINYTAGTGGNNVKAMSGLYGKNGWLGLSTIWVTGCTITKSETKINRSYMDYYPYNTAEKRKTVACHELGHSTALNHNTQSGSCLKSGVTTPSRPNQHDADQLDIIY